MCDEKCSQEGGHNNAHQGCCGWGHKSLLHWVIGLLVLVVVFWAGYKLGVLRGYFGGYYGGSPYNMMYNRGQGVWGPGMMSGWQQGNAFWAEKAVTSSVEKK